MHGIRSVLVLAALVAVVLGGITVRHSANKRQRVAEATRLVEGLLQADTSQVKTIIGNLADYREYANDDLNKAIAESPDDTNARLHAALAMLTEDQSVLPFLKERLLTVSPAQFQSVRDLLADHKTALIAGYWQIVMDSGQASARRFQAACALASYEPQNEHWQDEQVVRFVAGHLVAVPPSELLPWRNALRPVKAHLTAPLAAIYRDEEQGQQLRGFATDTLADYLSDDAESLFDLLADATTKQFAPMFGKLSDHRDKAIGLGNAEVNRTPPKDFSEKDKEAMAIRQANAAVMLLRMDAADNVWPLLKHSPDPGVRSYIIHWLSPRGGDPNTIIVRYQQETDVTIKRALLLCLGEFELDESQKQPLIEKLLAVYRSDPDTGLHAAAEWLLRKWKQGEKLAAVDNELYQKEAQLHAAKDSKRQWYVNSQGQTFVLLEAGEFQMGSPESEPLRNPNESLHQETIGRRIAISTKEVTRKQWQAFEMSSGLMRQNSESGRAQLDRYAPTNDCPMIGVLWYEAAWYCNWLSDSEGIAKDQWCYEPNEKGEYAPGMKAREGFLKLTGYRLPIEAEWEYVCRAGTTTAYSFGSDVTYLDEYALYQAFSGDRSLPTGAFKPNDFGLFDAHGNVSEWCHDEYYGDRCVYRGGAYCDVPLGVRSAMRFFHSPNQASNYIGLRPIRTFSD